MAADSSSSLTVASVAKLKATELLRSLEARLDADVLAFIGEIRGGSDRLVRVAVESLSTHRPKLAVILTTPGGIVEVVERIVETIRHYYREVVFVIPDLALSAGTVLAMSGDGIMMDFFSCLGPIDPQVEREGGKLVPALSYLIQYERLVEKSRQGTLTSAEFALLDKLDLADLHRYEEARELSITLLQTWLVRYKFKNWNTTETRGISVTQEMKVDRARDIAMKLSNPVLWHSHGRGINRATLETDLKLRIDDFGADPDLSALIRGYNGLLLDHMGTHKYEHFVHTREFF